MAYITCLFADWNSLDTDVVNSLDSLPTKSIPSKEVVRSFSIDREEYGRFEIAAKLWGVMDTARS